MASKARCTSTGTKYRDKPRCAREAGHLGPHRDTPRIQIWITREWSR